MWLPFNITQEIAREGLILIQRTDFQGGIAKIYMPIKSPSSSSVINFIQS